MSSSLRPKYSSHPHASGAAGKMIWCLSTDSARRYTDLQMHNSYFACRHCKHYTKIYKETNLSRSACGALRPQKSRGSYAGCHSRGVKRSDKPPLRPYLRPAFLEGVHSTGYSLTEIYLNTHQVIMCDIQVTTYASCRRNPQHQVRGDYLRCAAARIRSNQQLCLPASRQLRDLPLSLDAQDTNVQGECPNCNARSPTASSD